MKVALLAETGPNNGPCNVHASLVSHWPRQDSISAVRPCGKINTVLKCVKYGTQADVCISPCLNLPHLISHDLIHRSGKPLVHFNHGYVPFENEINGLGHGSFWLNIYRNALRNSDLIVANSKFQADFIQRHQPELVGKVNNIVLGVDRFEQLPWSPSDAPLRIAVSGGTRPIKGNDVVVSACSVLRSRGIDVNVKMFGSCDEDDELYPEIRNGNVEAFGQRSLSDFVAYLNSCAAFVMNSRHEPFGLSALDAIRSGCPVLISRNCGVLEVLHTRDSDVIEDCEDPEEVAEKIEYVISHPNAQRLYNTIDFDYFSWDNQTLILRNMCAEVCGR